jgi:hypothetical protein
MSHVAESDFCVTDIDLLRSVVEKQCPTLEVVKTNKYRTWASDHGALVGDYPLPGVYQVRVLRAAVEAMSMYKLLAQAAAQGIKLPTNLDEMEESPLSLADFNKLKQAIPEFAAAYESIASEIGYDADYVIQNKDPLKRESQYGIALVPNPVREGEWDMICDFYENGKGVLKEPGVGTHVQKDGEDIWAGTLKQAYNVAATLQAIQTQNMLGNPMYQSHSVETLPDGTVKISVSEY